MPGRGNENTPAEEFHGVSAFIPRRRRPPEPSEQERLTTRSRREAATQRIVAPFVWPEGEGRGTSRRSLSARALTDERHRHARAGLTPPVADILAGPWRSRPAVPARLAGAVLALFTALIFTALIAVTLMLPGAIDSAFAATVPTLRSASPAPGEVLVEAPVQLELTFSQALMSGTLGVNGPEGAAGTGKASISGTRITRQLFSDLIPGTYTVAWRAQGNSGGVSTGSYTFTLAPTPLPGAVAPPPTAARPAKVQAPAVSRPAQAPATSRPAAAATKPATSASRRRASAMSKTSISPSAGTATPSATSSPSTSPTGAGTASPSDGVAAAPDMESIEAFPGSGGSGDSAVGLTGNGITAGLAGNGNTGGSDSGNGGGSWSSFSGAGTIRGWLLAISVPLLAVVGGRALLRRRRMVLAAGPARKPPAPGVRAADPAPGSGTTGPAARMSRPAPRARMSGPGGRVSGSANGSAPRGRGTPSDEGDEAPGSLFIPANQRR